MITVLWLPTAQSINTTMAALIPSILEVSSDHVVITPLNTSFFKLFAVSTLMGMENLTMLNFPISSGQPTQQPVNLMLSLLEQAAHSNQAKVFAAHPQQDQAR
jgi:hypothetical protein